MKKWWYFLILIIAIYGCNGQNDRPEIIYEAGVAVVVNGLEPYKLPSPALQLEEKLTIDLEDEAVSSSGLYEMDTFGIDVQGNIYILMFQSDQDHIYKFNSRGEFELSFGKKGEGPGEFDRPVSVTVTPGQEIMISDPGNAKLAYFQADGGLVREVSLTRNVPFIYPLAKESFVVFGRITPDPEADTLSYPLELCNSSLELQVKLDEFKLENFRMTRRLRGTQPGFGVAFGGGRIFTGNEARDYEIWVYDDSGNLQRKIRKQYEPLPVPDAMKEQILQRNNENMRPMIYFPDYLPPFRTLAADEKGRLLVVTFAPGEKPGENWIDVFDPEGTYIDRLSAAVFVNMSTPIHLIVRNDHLFYIREKENGFKQLVVEKII